MSDIPWSEYPTIATHSNGLLLVRHPNGPALVNGGHLSTVSFIVRCLAENGKAVEAAEIAEWVAFQLFEGPKEIPRRFGEWSEEDGDVLWWNVAMTGGEITEPPGLIGRPTDLNWPYDPGDEEEADMLWVPLPKLARGKP